MSDEVLNVTKWKVFLSVPTLINGRQGMEQMVASSVLTVSNSFRINGFSGRGYVVLQYGYYECIFVAFNESKDGTVMANATYVHLDDEMAEAMRDDQIAEYIKTLGIGGVVVQELN